MSRGFLALVAAGLVAVTVAGEAKAQMMPMWDVNGLARQNIQFGQQMDQLAWQQSWRIAASLPPGYQVPANPHMMDGYRAASAAYIHGMQANSVRTSNAIERTGQAFRGNALYINPNTGAGCYLPWSGGPVYNVGPYNYATPGPRYDRGVNYWVR
jgi:hypothetical protein